jgi:hypothetical protein
MTKFNAISIHSAVEGRGISIISITAITATASLTAVGDFSLLVIFIVATRRF